MSNFLSRFIRPSRQIIRVSALLYEPPVWGAIFENDPPSLSSHPSRDNSYPRHSRTALDLIYRSSLTHSIAVVTNYDFHRNSGKMPRAQALSPWRAGLPRRSPALRDEGGFFDITFWGAYPPAGAVRRALASNTLG